MKKLTFSVLALSLLATNSNAENAAKPEKHADLFYGVYTSDAPKNGCTILDSAAVRNIAYYSSLSSPKAIAEWVEKESGRLKYFAIKEGMNSIISYRENLELSMGGGIATFTGVGVKLECPLEL